MSISSYIRKHSFITSIIVVILVILAIIIGRNGGKTVVTTVDSTEKKVTLVNAATFKQGSNFISGNGIVESRGQADLKSQTSAPISAIYGSIGDTVYAGQTILELENADTRAQLDQAKASLALAEGQYFTGGVSLDSAKSGAIDKIRDSYLKGYDAVNTNIDPLLNNYDGNGGRLSSFIIDTKISNNIIDVRIDLITALRTWKTTVDTLSASSSYAELQSAVKSSSNNLDTIDRLLSNISQALNDAAKYSTPTFMAFLNSWKSVVSGARASVSGANQALSGAEASLTGASAAYGTTAPAQVSSAKAGVTNLEAQLAKTIIKSPINGKIASLPLGVGELASPGALLATVVGDEGLEVKAYVSGEDLSRIKIGAPVTIQGKVKGIVSSVAPSLNNTNRKVEVVISVNSADVSNQSNQNNSSLVIGQNVQISIQAEVAKTSTANNSIADKSVYTLPIQDVKIVPGDAYVFTVDENSKIKSNPVVLGQVKGDFIEVVGGLTDDMNIVSPVYELDPGQKVTAE